MTFKDYQLLALRTCKPLNNQNENIVHMALGIVSEYFEVLQALSESKLTTSTEEQIAKTEELMHELGDILWYTAGLAHFTGLDFSRGHDFRKTSIKHAIERVSSIAKSTWVYNRPIDQPDKTGYTPWQQLQIAIYNIIMWVEIEFPFKIEKVFTENINKLAKRFPEAYSDAAANNRKED